MAHAFLLGAHVVFIVLIGRYFNGYVFRDGQPVRFKANSFDRIVGHQAHFANAQFLKNLSPDAVITFVGVESQV